MIARNILSPPPFSCHFDLKVETTPLDVPRFSHLIINWLLPFLGATSHSLHLFAFVTWLVHVIFSQVLFILSTTYFLLSYQSLPCLISLTGYRFYNNKTLYLNNQSPITMNLLLVWCAVNRKYASNFQQT